MCSQKQYKINGQTKPKYICIAQINYLKTATFVNIIKQTYIKWEKAPPYKTNLWP